MLPAAKPPTFADLYRQLCALPDNVTGEIIAGELVVSPRPAAPHAKVGSDAIQQIGFRYNRKPGGVDGPGGWWILGGPELHLGEEVLVPDIAGWKRETLPAIPRTAAFTVRPDWVGEVLSPATSRRDKQEKARSYHRAGVNWLWLIDPLERTVEALRRDGEFWVRLGVWADDEKARIEPFDVVELDLSQWWEGIAPEEPAP